jgi:hypothetical protein
MLDDPMAVRAVTSLVELQQLAARARPQQVLAGERVLVVREDLAPLLPLGGLRRGTVTGVDSRGLLHALLAEPSRTGSWIGLVGLGSLGLAAAVEAGIVAERTVVVDPQGPARPAGPGAGVLVDAVAALIDALDIVVLGPRVALAAAPCRRLEARARERGAVVMVVDAPGREPPISTCGWWVATRSAWPPVTATSMGCGPWWR